MKRSVPRWCLEFVFEDGVAPSNVYVTWRRLGAEENPAFCDDVVEDGGRLFANVPSNVSPGEVTLSIAGPCFVAADVRDGFDKCAALTRPTFRQFDVVVQ